MVDPVRGFAIEAMVDQAISREVALRCAYLGYRSLWTNNPPSGLAGLDTVARWLDVLDDDGIEVGVAVVPLDHYGADAIAKRVAELGIDLRRLWLGVGSGQAANALDVVDRGAVALREALPGVRLVLGALGPRMLAAAGSSYDGAFLNWVTPASARSARGRAGGSMLAYVRVAVDDTAADRLAQAQAMAATIHDGYARHFERQGAPPALIGVASSSPAVVDAALSAFDALDLVVVRPLADPTVAGLGAVALAAAPSAFGRDQFRIRE
jgi:hypothetical protein